MKRSESDWNVATTRLLDNPTKERSAYPQSLKFGQQHDLRNLDVLISVFDADGAAPNTVALHDLVHGGVPGSLDVSVLAPFEPGPELPLDYITVGLMMHVAGEIRV